MQDSAEKQFVAMVGGINMDITGTSDAAFLQGDSNPGSIGMTPGGVGRNIAENIARLGRNVLLVTVLGDDPHGFQLVESCKAMQIDLSEADVLIGERTSTYLCINDADGDLVGAVSDMQIYEKMTPQLIEPKLEMLNRAQAVIVDANLPEEALVFLAKHVNVPLFADPVSVSKAGRIRSILPHCVTIKPNRPEAALLCSMEINSDEDLKKAAAVMLEAGMKYALISLGSRGVYWSNGHESGITPCLDTAIVNTTGCGDAFLAACVDAYLDGCDIREMT